MMHEILIAFQAIFSGIITGFAISILPGPAGMESIKRTMKDGIKSGLVFITGSLCADACYLLITSIGMAQLDRILNDKVKSIFFMISGLILLAVSIRSLFQIEIQNKCTKKVYSKNNNSIIYSVFIAFIITLLNPIVCGTWVMLSSMAISIWKSIGPSYYYTYLMSTLTGMSIWFYGINFVAYKGKKKSFMTAKLNNNIKTFLDIFLMLAALGSIICGIYTFIH